jgi:hypothetical protein
MERAKVVKEESFEENTHFLAACLETKNSCLILLSEREDRLGTLAVAVPKPSDTPGLPASSVLLGDRNMVSARMFAEYVAARTDKIALVSIYLETATEIQAQSIFKKLIEKVASARTEAKEEGAAA